MLTAVGLAAGLSGPAAFMAAMGFVLSVSYTHLFRYSKLMFLAEKNK